MTFNIFKNSRLDEIERRLTQLEAEVKNTERVFIGKPPFREPKPWCFGTPSVSLGTAIRAILDHFSMSIEYIEQTPAKIILKKNK
jgi:hypothetical protein